MRKIIFTIILIVCITIMNTGYVSAEETYSINDEDMVITDFEVEENYDDDINIPQTDQELMDLDDLLMTIADKSFSRCWDMTNQTNVETGGIAIGNSNKSSTKNSIYAIKVTHKDAKQQSAKLYTSGLKDSSSSSKTINKNLGHANDMTYGYDPATKNHVLFVAPLYNEKIHKISSQSCDYQIEYETDKTYCRGAIAYTGSTSGSNYITRTKDTTTYHFEHIEPLSNTQGKFYTDKTFYVSFKNTNEDTTTMQGICVYKNYLYIAARKNSNNNNLVYKVTTAINNISNGSTVIAERAYNLGATTTVYDSSDRPFEIESIDMVNDVCYFTANINAGSNDSGIGDFVGKFNM